MSAARAPRRTLGTVLLVLGLVMIVGATLYVADASQGGRTRRSFEERIGYDEAKQYVHASFPTGIVVGLAGLAATMVGAHLRRRVR